MSKVSAAREVLQKSSCPVEKLKAYEDIFFEDQDFYQTQIDYHRYCIQTVVSVAKGSADRTNSCLLMAAKKGYVLFLNEVVEALLPKDAYKWDVAREKGVYQYLLDQFNLIENEDSSALVKEARLTAVRALLDKMVAHQGINAVKYLCGIQSQIYNTRENHHVEEVAFWVSMGLKYRAVLKTNAQDEMKNIFFGMEVFDKTTPDSQQKMLEYLRRALAANPEGFVNRMGVAEERKESWVDFVLTHRDALGLNDMQIADAMCYIAEGFDEMTSPSQHEMFCHFGQILKKNIENMAGYSDELNGLLGVYDFSHPVRGLGLPVIHYILENVDKVNESFQENAMSQLGQFFFETLVHEDDYVSEDQKKRWVAFFLEHESCFELNDEVLYKLFEYAQSDETLLREMFSRYHFPVKFIEDDFVEGENEVLALPLQLLFDQVLNRKDLEDKLEVIEKLVSNMLSIGCFGLAPRLSLFARFYWKQAFRFETPVKKQVGAYTAVNQPGVVHSASIQAPRQGGVTPCPELYQTQEKTQALGR